jgi:hypothetical protein
MQTKKKYVLILSGILLSLFMSCGPSFIYKSYWQKTPVVIDGKTNDWDVPLRFFDPKTRLNYSVSNDGENLYICIRATDDDNVSAIMRDGLQIWIDTLGRKGHQVGILCPVPLTKDEAEKKKNRSEMEGTTDYNGLPDTARMNRIHQRFLDNAKQMRVSGFKIVPNGLLALPNTYNINLGISWNNSNVLVYEAAIPFKSFLKYPLSPSDSTRSLGITFNYTITHRRMNMGNSGGGGRSGMGAGGMNAGASAGANHGSVETVGEPETIWTPFHLSTK